MRIGSGGDEAFPNGEAHEAGGLAQPQLAHEAGAVTVDGTRGDTELALALPSNKFPTLIQIILFNATKG